MLLQTCRHVQLLGVPLLARSYLTAQYVVQGPCVLLMWQWCCCCPAGKGAAAAAPEFADDELAEDIYAGEEDELRPERPDQVRLAAAAAAAPLPAGQLQYL
jgi:hypothetical protein